jgi:hypothetical protein
MSISRAMLLHSAIHWPDMAAPTLWPMAVAHATYLWNHVPDIATGLSPADLFTKTRWPQHRFHDLHVWGCPAYVLDKSIADGMKIPKWKPRSQRCVYLGKSPKHASNVPLVLNPATGAITGQFHVVLDDWFATVGSDCTILPDFNSDEWKKLFGESSFQYLEDDSLLAPDLPSFSDSQAHTQATLKQDAVAAAQNHLHPSIKLPVTEPATQISPLSPPVSDNKPSQPVIQRTPHQSTHTSFDDSFRRESTESTEEPTATYDSTAIGGNSSPKQVSTPQSSPMVTSPPTNLPSPAPTPTAIPSPSARPSRNRKPITRLTYDGTKESFTGKTYLAAASNNYASSLEAICAYFSLYYETFIGKASTKSQSDPDLFSYNEAMASPDAPHWITAACNEVQSLEEHNTWTEIPMDQATKKVVPGTWVFRIKRNPDGTFKKYKARYCLRGDLEESDSETYSPVVAYWVVRLFLVLSLLLRWETVTIDFSNAFVQAILEEETYIHIPRGFKSTLDGPSCLKLYKSIYGKRDSPRLWFQCILKVLLSLGFVQSQHDACLLIRSDCILILFVDDLGICYKSKQVLEELLAAIEKKGYQFTRQDSFNEYLGIKYEELSDGSIKMTQPGLVNKIIEAVGMQQCNPSDNPTTQQALGTHPDNPAMTESWNYRSIVGMMLYLSGNTRLDIAYGVSQVARFSHQPKQPHAVAVKRIVRYLKATAHEGTIFKPPDSIHLDLYVDADFAGLWGVESPSDPVSVKSRSGHLISLSGCYLIGKTNLQTSIAQSTGESEYIALSHALRALLPIRSTLIETLDALDLPGHLKQTVPSTVKSHFETLVHEDNNSALMLATDQRVTPRTKHYAVKLHWFWSVVNDASNNISVVKIDTKLQQADYLTKGLPTVEFEQRRKMSQGW